ncbi:hypothetical protein [Rhodococcus sp. UNC363MFTsu5.1]|uniref:hypothetical protein n=1 Tax=Rhodococcus sp. UNC363MFTsu5.1 TaxID=1449069 RepID=UPI0012DD7FC4|nr:hypothetical protein [Rhodococcus sp. UNC363MFTsu5.1]
MSPTEHFGVWGERGGFGSASEVGAFALSGAAAWKCVDSVVDGDKAADFGSEVSAVKAVGDFSVVVFDGDAEGGKLKLSGVDRGAPEVHPGSVWQSFPQPCCSA